MEDYDWKLWVGIGIMMFAGGFLFIFFFGNSLDYTIDDGTQQTTGNILKDILPKWLFPPER